MNAKLFVTTCRAEVLGRSHRLQDAIDLARSRTADTWMDVVVWQGTEVVAVVGAGGIVLPVKPGYALTDADAAGDEAIVDLALLRDD